MSEEKECRICYLEEIPEKEMISPCLCNGTSKWIHRECLEIWRALNVNRDAYYMCMECHGKYQLIKKYPWETFKIICPKSFEWCFMASVICNSAIGATTILTIPHSVDFYFLRDDLLKKIVSRGEDTRFFYNYSLIWLIMIYTFHLIFLFQTNKKIYRRSVYWQVFFKEYASILLFSNHFFLWYFFVGYLAHEYIIFIVLESLTSFITTIIFMTTCHRHNKVITFMNAELNYDYVIEDFEHDVHSPPPSQEV
jgi:hypothetical protein